MKLLTELKVKLNWTEKDMFDAIKKTYGIFPDEIERFEVVRESLDARKKPDVVVKLNVAVCVKKQAFKKVLKCNDILVNHDGILVQKADFNAFPVYRVAKSEYKGFRMSVPLGKSGTNADVGNARVTFSVYLNFGVINSASQKALVVL